MVSTSILLLVKLLITFSSWDFSEPIEQAVVVAMWFTLSDITEPLYQARTSALCSIAQSKPSTTATQVTNNLEVTQLLMSICQLMPSLLRLGFKQNRGQDYICYAVLHYLLTITGSPSPSVGAELVKSGNETLSSRSCRQRGDALCIACTMHALCMIVATFDVMCRCAALAGGST